MTHQWHICSLCHGVGLAIVKRFQGSQLFQIFLQVGRHAPLSNVFHMTNNISVSQATTLCLDIFHKASSGISFQMQSAEERSW